MLQPFDDLFNDTEYKGEPTQSISQQKSLDTSISNIINLLLHIKNYTKD